MTGCAQVSWLRPPQWFMPVWPLHVAAYNLIRLVNLLKPAMAAA